jgi:Zn finger protein HypA/HybF involved in hydrogenase expression
MSTSTCKLSRATVLPSTCYCADCQRREREAKRAGRCPGCGEPRPCPAALIRDGEDVWSVPACSLS